MRAQVTHILASAEVVRERRLPVPGQVVAQINQKVSATDVIAKAEYDREHIFINVARQFGISTKAADRLIQCKVGEQLKKGDVIAQGGGFLPKIVRVPLSGRVAAIGGGKILLTVAISNIELRAGFPGLVTQIIPDRGVVIQVSGALIQGVWGNGCIDTGLLVSVIKRPDEILDANCLDISLRGSVILGGFCQDAETLRAAAELPVRGLILSSIPPNLISLALQMRYPILVTDGFGRQPTNPYAFKILTANDKREITINAEPFDRYGDTHPEAIIPLPISQELFSPRYVEAVAPGQEVWLRRAPHAGEIGTLVNLPERMVTLSNGLRVTAGEVRLEDGEKIIVPLVNLEVVG